jgi:hypothetical protein
MMAAPLETPQGVEETVSHVVEQLDSDGVDEKVNTRAAKRVADRVAWTAVSSGI